jgi:arylsulfatase A-like enzyme
LADHGEGFWEHGFGEHGNAFYDEAIKVPLILVPPAGTTGHRDRVDAPVSNIDVFATILDIAGVQLPAGAKGVSLVGPSRSGTDGSRVLFSESAHSYDIHARAIIHRGFKYTVYPGLSPAQRFLFDLGADPTEQHDLYDAKPDLAAMLHRLVGEHAEEALHARERLTQRTVEPSAEMLEGLRSLGYVR